MAAFPETAQLGLAL